MTIRFQQIVNAAARYYGLTRADIFGPCRARRYSRPRQMVMLLARAHTKLSQPQIGMLLKRDHTTILHGCRSATALLEGDLDAQNDRQMIEAALVAGVMPEPKYPPVEATPEPTPPPIQWVDTVPVVPEGDPLLEALRRAA